MRAKNTVTAIETASAPRRGLAPSIGPEIVVVVPRLVDTAVELARGYNRRAELRTQVEAWSAIRRERRKAAGTLLHGYVRMREDMCPEDRRSYHRGYLELLLDGLGKGSR